MPAVAPRSPVAISLLTHLAFTALVFGFGFWSADRESKSVTVPLEVIEAPRPALSPLRPKSQPAPKPKEADKPRSVFGANRKSRRSETGPEVKAGNTTAKAQDDEKLKDDDADSLPIPADEFLVTRMPELLADTRVPYPEEAKRKGIQGAVIFDLLIDEQGSVRQATLVEGPGHGLNEAAQAAVEKLKFKPAFIDDRAVPVRIRYAYRFVLEK